MWDMRTALLSIIIFISLVIGAATLRRGHEWGDDFAWYILQARSILEGTTDEFMQQSIFTNWQSTTHVGPLAYPWGYPLILAPVYAVKGISPLALKLPSLFFFAGFLVCLYFLYRDRLTQTESLILVAVFAFNPLLLQFLDQIPDLWRTALGTNVIWGIPFGFLVMLAVWNRYDTHLEEASRDLGANQLRTFREVTLPQLFPAVVAGGLLAFTFSFDDVVLSTFVSSPGSTTLPIRVFSELRFGLTPRPNVVAMTMLAITLTAIVTAQVMLRRAGQAVVPAAKETDAGAGG